MLSEDRILCKENVHLMDVKRFHDRNHPPVMCISSDQILFGGLDHRYQDKGKGIFFVTFHVKKKLLEKGEKLLHNKKVTRRDENSRTE